MTAAEADDADRRPLESTVRRTTLGRRVGQVSRTQLGHIGRLLVAFLGI